MSEALELLEVAAQQLAAPERPVGSVARPVEDERERRPFLAVLGEAGRGVGVVMLDADELRVLLERPLGRQVLGMEVVRDDLGLDREHGEHELEIGAERTVGGLRVEIPEMGREERLTAACDAERRLQLGARCDDRPQRGHRQRQRRRRITPRPAHREGGANDRVLAATVDRPVMGQKGVGDPGEPPAGVVVVERDRLVGAVAARQHERARRARRRGDGGAASTGA